MERVSLTFDFLLTLLQEHFLERDRGEKQNRKQMLRSPQGKSQKIRRKGLKFAYKGY